MLDYRFDRACRTPYSEAYVIYDDQNEAIGRVDLHFTHTVVHGTLCLNEELSTETLHDMIELIDDELVISSDALRTDFIISVFQGHNVGIFSDEDVEEWAEEESKGNGHKAEGKE
ncbi:MAG: hypothetical protein HY664_02290 [Chloroflexi bacterium]|nr:hypothetical protein [Chloroflexota bacterium]